MLNIGRPIVKIGGAVLNIGEAMLNIGRPILKTGGAMINIG
jgi:hypothetical protein